LATRLRCDRALPACGNCVNRGDITACRYDSRRAESRPELPASSDPSYSAQARIDHLEQLVLTLLKESRSTQNQVNSSPARIDARLDGRLTEADANDHERDKHGATGPPDKQTTTALARSGTVININTDYKERLSVDEAHWTLLLNEVRGTGTPYLF